jgi:DNA-binding response OmpR family regulator
LVDNNCVNYKWLTFNLFNNEFYYKWKKICLTKKNKYLLSIFLKNYEILLNERFLISKIWWDIDFIVNRNLRVNILRLKLLLKPCWINTWIKNIRWEWYIFKEN